MIKIAKKIFYRCRRWFYTRKVASQCKSYQSITLNNKSSVTSSTVLGNNVHFNGMEVEGRGPVKIGDNFHSGSGCIIIAQNHNYNGSKIPYDHTFVAQGVTIENNVWVGRRVIILDGVRIGEGAIIQAGSCVVEDIPRLAIAGGHPAKVFSARDFEHYETLKAKSAFM